MFNAVTSRCQSYWSQIPTNTLDTVVKSATYAFVVNILIVRGSNPATYNLVRPLANTVISAVAAAIYGLTVPLFRKIFDTKNRDQIAIHHEFIKVTVVNVLTSVLFAYATTAKVNLFAFKWLPMIPCNFFVSILDLPFILLEIPVSVVNRIEVYVDHHAESQRTRSVVRKVSGVAQNVSSVLQKVRKEFDNWKIRNIPSNSGSIFLAL